MREWSLGCRICAPVHSRREISDGHCHEAHIEAGRVDKDALLVETDDMNDKIDAAYRAKYHRYAESIVGSVVSPNARAATLKLVPR